MKKKEIKLTVTLTFSGDGVKDEAAVVANVMDALKHQADHAGIVADGEEEFTEMIDVRNANGNGLTLDVKTGEAV